MRLGLPPMRALCRQLGSPEQTFRPILVAGTNGKGSVAAAIAAGLQSAGLKTGLYTSPHLVSVVERFRVEGGPPCPPHLEDALSMVRQAAAELGDTPTYFEATTAAAFTLFAMTGCRAAVLEVGMGGRLDATNVVEPELSVVTRICLDHTEILGGSLAVIAREKAGILREGVPVVVAPQEEEAMRALEAEAERVGSPLVRAEESASVEEDEGKIVVRTAAGAYGPLRPAMDGRHQHENFLAAVRALETLGQSGWKIPPRAVELALRKGRIPGRLDRRPGDPEVILDGAHNPAAARALAAWLEEEGLRPVLLFGCMEDKDAEGMLAPLLARSRACYLTAVDSPRAAEPAALLDLAGRLTTGKDLEDLPFEKAFGSARARAGKDGCPLLVAGSLYLVGAVLERMEGSSDSSLD